MFLCLYIRGRVLGRIPFVFTQTDAFPFSIFREDSTFVSMAPPKYCPFVTQFTKKQLPFIEMSVPGVTKITWHFTVNVFMALK
jgi:hypothetical protein